MTEFLADTPRFLGGIRVAAGDLNGDGRADIITALGAGASPEVRVFNGKDQVLMASFLAGDATFHGGVYVAAGDVNGDGVADIVTGLGAGSKPRVSVFSGARSARTPLLSCPIRFSWLPRSLANATTSAHDHVHRSVI